MEQMVERQVLVTEREAEADREVGRAASGAGEGCSGGEGQEGRPRGGGAQEEGCQAAGNVTVLYIETGQCSEQYKVTLH